MFLEETIMLYFHVFPLTMTQKGLIAFKTPERLLFLTLNMPWVENYTFMPWGVNLTPPPKISARSCPIFKKLDSMVYRNPAKKRLLWPLEENRHARLL